MLVVGQEQHSLGHDRVPQADEGVLSDRSQNKKHLLGASSRYQRSDHGLESIRLGDVRGEGSIPDYQAPHVDSEVGLRN